jgi:hypothetical protein
MIQKRRKVGKIVRPFCFGDSLVILGTGAYLVEKQLLGLGEVCAN